jgi:hypothetical protein
MLHALHGGALEVSGEVFSANRSKRWTAAAAT